jgi:hypothetical protein
MISRAASLMSFTGCSRFKALVKRNNCIQSKEVSKFRCSFAASAAHIQYPAVQVCLKTHARTVGLPPLWHKVAGLQ